MTKLVTPHGSLVLRRRTKHPVRVAAGKIAHAAKDDPKGQVRSSHLGYDCYITGNLNNGGRTRIIMRRSRMPPHIPPDMIAIMPVEMWWPQRDHRASHALIEAVITSDVNTLAAWKSSWPEHEFGYERFMELCERRLTGIRNDQKQAGPPKRTDESSNVIPATAMFPGHPVSIERHGSRDLGPFCVRTFIVRFDDGLVALRVDVKGVVESPEDVQRVPCTSAYVDLIDGRFEIIAHYPGRLRALGLPAGLIYHVLGVRPPSSSNRRSISTNLRPRAPRPDTPRRHADAVAERARTMQTLLSTGDPNAEVIRDPVRVEPIPMVGNMRHEREVAGGRAAPGGREAVEEEFERFPDAPGSRPSR